jgi:hypothetical protein
MEYYESFKHSTQIYSSSLFLTFLYSLCLCLHLYFSLYFVLLLSTSITAFYSRREFFEVLKRSVTPLFLHFTG